MAKTKEKPADAKKKKPADEPKKKISAYEKYMASDFEARNDNELILSVKSLYRYEQQSIIPTYWQIGKIVHSYYKGKYGDNEIEKVVDETSIREGTLRKCCRFAKKYEKKDLNALLKSKGKFVMSWHLIAQNLVLKPKQLIEAYENSTIKSEFCNTVTELKNPNKKNRKKNKKIEPTVEQPEDDEDDTDTGDETNDEDTDTGNKTNDGDDPAFLTAEELEKKSEDEAKSIMKLKVELETLKDMVRGAIKDTENRKSIFKMIKKITEIVDDTKISPSRHPISAQN